ncbi:hypothetical protein TUM19329_23140 [Legionella antarctica]|uniref:VOC domain-containing protein n=1 Tax=Legionella antarctica TaxID=2708020 RepID=A0A6F8T6W3_9GAMM|nr:VOC family protein [Legionella antarctica]BCA95953.1 hypothetical protein TUM19329_23140 [Legionella antarctica]
MTYLISGIQQIGIGNLELTEAFSWYRKNFGMDIPLFDQESEVSHMLLYTGGEAHQRHAVLAINLKGGGGFEMWQYKTRDSMPCLFTVSVGDLGFTIAKMKTEDVHKTYARLKHNKLNLITPVTTDPNGQKHFYLKDLSGNMFEIIEGNNWFSKGVLEQGGVSGMVIGVSNMEKSINFYSSILGYDTVVYDKSGVFSDWKGVEGSSNKVRRVLLKHSQPRQGAFSKLLGSSVIELVQFADKKGKKIFAGRFWGDQGFIHFCFDIYNMPALKKHCESQGYQFLVESNPDFDMGDAAGHFAYIEDPDGALIEFVETYKIPILKKMGWYLNLQKRDSKKPLPDWILKVLRFSRI